MWLSTREGDAYSQEHGKRPLTPRVPYHVPQSLMALRSARTRESASARRRLGLDSLQQRSSHHRALTKAQRCSPLLPNAMNWFQPRLVHSVLRSCRSFTTSSSSSFPGPSSGNVARALVHRRRAYANTALFWGSALAIAAGLTLSSTIHLDANQPVEVETRGP